MAGKRENADAISQAWLIRVATEDGPHEGHPHLQVNDLSAERQVLLGESVRRMQEESRKRGRTTEEDMEMAYQAAIWNFGVDCPHPGPRHDGEYQKHYNNQRAARLSSGYPADDLDLPIFIMECRSCRSVIFRDPRPAKQERNHG